VTGPARSGAADAAEIRAELDAWIAAHWDPELSLAQWRARLAGSSTKGRSRSGTVSAIFAIRS